MEPSIDWTTFEEVWGESFMNENEIKGIVFDLGGVLVHLNSDAFYKVWGHRRGKDVGEFVEAIEAWGMYDLWERGGCSEAEFFEGFKEWIGVSTIGLEEFRTHWNGIFPKAGAGIAPLLKKLKKKYRLFVLSNTTDTHYNYLEERFAWLALFEEVFTSFGLKGRKPEAEIFERMLKKIPIPRKHLLYIDDRKENLVAAEKAGMMVEHCPDPKDLKEVLTKRDVLE